MGWRWLPAHPYWRRDMYLRRGRGRGRQVQRRKRRLLWRHRGRGLLVDDGRRRNRLIVILVLLLLFLQLHFHKLLREVTLWHREAHRLVLGLIAMVPRWCTVSGRRLHHGLVGLALLLRHSPKQGLRLFCR